EKNWGRMIPKGDDDSIVAWCDEFSTSGSEDPEAVVIEALKCCLDADVRNVKYLRAVLTDWREAGILSVDQVKAREAEHVSQRKSRRNKDPVDKPRSVKTEPGKYDKFYL
ncbi:MAG TPA: DnaD domain protein, partial [Desulfosporosinus sp.]|nr:DnaD domain protein [Desulfosporosinus sp.]